MPHTFVAPFMDLAMNGLYERVPDPKAKQDEVGVPPARPVPPCEAGTSLGVCPVGYEVNSVRPNTKR